MKHRHEPLWLDSLLCRYRDWLTDWFLTPQLASCGTGLRVNKPRHVHLSGPGIHVRDHVHLHAEPGQEIHISTWSLDDREPVIDIGAYTIVNPAVRIIAAEQVRIGTGCMFATGAYVTDADWHGIYDRALPPGDTEPVTLGDNVWVADGARVLKGITVGDNAIVAAGAVAVADVPANTVVAGNPARVVRELDPERAGLTRRALFEELDYLNFERRYVQQQLDGNSLLGYLRTRLMPRQGD